MKIAEVPSSTSLQERNNPIKALFEVVKKQRYKDGYRFAVGMLYEGCLSPSDASEQLSESCTTDLDTLFNFPDDHKTSVSKPKDEFPGPKTVRKVNNDFVNESKSNIFLAHKLLLQDCEVLHNGELIKEVDWLIYMFKHNPKLVDRIAQNKEEAKNYADVFYLLAAQMTFDKELARKLTPGSFKPETYSPGGTLYAMSDYLRDLAKQLPHVKSERQELITNAYTKHK